MHQQFLASPNNPEGGAPFSDSRPQGAIRLPHGHGRLRTADALRPGNIHNTWPARPPRQPCTSKLQKIPSGTSSGQLTTSFILSAEVRGPQTATLTRSFEIPLTRPEVTAPVRNSCWGAPRPFFWTPASSFVAHFVYSKGVPGHHALLWDPLKVLISRKASIFL